MSSLYKTIFGKKLKKRFTFEEAINILESLDLINIGEVAERAISIGSGVALCSKNTPKIDLKSGKQIKRGKTNPHTQGHSGTLKAYLNIENQTATILFVATERLTGKDYYFVFPYSAYKSHNGNSISVPFELDGRPKRTNHWWLHEKSWEELCEAAK